MTPGRRGWIVLGALTMLAASLHASRAHDHDHPELDAWYATLMQPDRPGVSCCGKADDYFARGDKAFCRITDDRTVPGRPHIDVGTEIEIPPHKLKWDRGNPTGHAVVFVNVAGAVFCFVQNGGV